MPAKTTRVFPLPNRFVPGVPAVEQEFETKADAERFLDGETGGIKHASAFTATEAEAEEIIEPDKGDK